MLDRTAILPATTAVVPGVAAVRPELAIALFASTMVLLFLPNY